MEVEQGGGVGGVGRGYGGYVQFYPLMTAEYTWSHEGDGVPRRCRHTKGTLFGVCTTILLTVRLHIYCRANRSGSFFIDPTTTNRLGCVRVVTRRKNTSAEAKNKKLGENKK